MSRFALPMFFALLAACGPTADGDPDARANGGGDAAQNIDGASAVDADAAIADAAADAPDFDAAPPGNTVVYFHGDFEVNGTFHVGTWDLQAAAGATLALSGFTGTSHTSIDMSPDGLTLAVSGLGGGGNDVLFLFASDGSGSPTALHTTAGSTVEIRDVSFSPDGNRIAFLSDAEVNGADALYVIPSSGGTPKRVSQASIATQSVYDYRWAPNSTHIAYVGDLVVADEEGLWTVDVTAVNPNPVEILGAADTPNVNQGPASSLAFDNTNRVYFRSDHELTDNHFRLYRATLDGTTVEPLAGTSLANTEGEAAIGTFAISPDRTRIAFASNAPNADLYQVYVMSLSGASPVLVSNVTTTSVGDVEGPSFFEDMVWSPDGSKLAVSADWKVGGIGIENDFSLFLVPTSGTPGGRRLVIPSAAGGDVKVMGFSESSSRVVVLGDLLVDNLDQLYVISEFDTADQLATDLVVEEAVSDGDVAGFVLHP